VAKRFLNDEERLLIGYLLDVNAGLSEKVISSLRQDVDRCMVEEIGSRYALSFECGDKGGEDSRLPVELIASDNGVPVLVYAVAVLGESGWRLGMFCVDRLDGEDVCNYPNNLERMMLVEDGMMKGGMDLRDIYIVQ